MKRFHVLAGVLLLGLGTAAPAADVATLQKSFFGSTKPGSWVKYEQTNTDAKGKVQKSEVTLSRLEGEGARIWIEMRVVPKEGAKGKPTTLKYLLNTDFKIEKDALAYMKHVEKMIMQEDGKEATEFPPEMMQQAAAAFMTNVDYGANVTSLGPCGADGKAGEKIGIQGSYDVKILFMRMKGTTESELCMNDSIPFGRLYEKTVTKDDKGKQTGTTEMKVLDSGTGAVSAIKGPVKAVEMPKMPWGS
ncbi:MAG: hypothetical protein U0529_10485 [Thermoanaerobaculia bacterium]